MDSPLRTETDLCGIWEFRPEGGAPASIPVPAQWTHGASFALPSAWERVRHATYARDLALPAWRPGRRLELRFGAVMLHARVSLDGTGLGGHAGGFTPFSLAVPEPLWRARAGSSVRLEVAVESGQAALRDGAALHQLGYPDDSEEGPVPGGIWQPVALHELPQTRIAGWHHAWSHRRRALALSVEVAGAAAAVRATLGRGRGAATLTMAVAGGAARGTLRLPARFAAWNWRSPVLHPLRFELLDAEGAVIDRLDQRLGLREVAVAGSELRWNGASLRLRGISLIRQRVAPWLWRRDYLRLYLGRLRNLGFNAVRLHAAIAPPVVLEVCDELGLVAIDQSAVWSALVGAYRAGGEEFLANTCREYDEWIARDRNHPCVAAWDVENEMVRIDPVSLPWVERLIAHVRSRSPLPVLASGAGTLGGTDAVHLHCYQHGHRLQPAPAALRRPLIQGEWWGPDLAYRDTLRAANRILPDAVDTPALMAALAAWNGREIAEHRLRGAAGTFPFALEVLLFRPPFAAGEAIAAPAGPGEPALVRAELFQRERNWHMVRRPLVDPGWRDGRARVDLEPALARAVRAANAPLLLALRDLHRDLRGGGRVRRTVALANDCGTDLAGGITLRLRAGRRTLASARARCAVAEGRTGAVTLELELPTVAAPTRLRLEAVFTGGGRRAAASGELWVWPAAAAPARPALPVVMLGTGPAATRHLRRLGARPAATLPAGPAVAVVGAIPAALDRAAVVRFLDQGGRLVLLRQDRDPDAVPLPFRVRSADEMPRPEVAGLRLRPDQCTWLEEARFPDPRHPALAALPGGGLRPFAAGDHRLADHAWLRPGVNPPPLAGPQRVLATGFDRSQAALVECPDAHGLVLACQLRLEENLGRDPQADALLDGLVAHAAAWTPPAATAAGSDAAWLAARTGLKADNDAAVRVLDDPAEAAAALAASADPASPLHAWLRAGGRLLLALPAGLDAAGLRTRALPPGDLLCACQGEPLGWTSLELDPCLGLPGAALIEPGPGWRRAVAVTAQDPGQAYAGMMVGEALGALVAVRRIGRGALWACGVPLARRERPLVALLWDQALCALGAAAARRAEAADDLVPAHATVALPLDGDLRKWTNQEPDVNIAPWSCARAVVVDERHRLSREGDAPAPPFQRAAAFYLLHDRTHLWLAAQVLAPSFDFADIANRLYRADSIEVRIGDTWLLASRRADGGLFVHAMGSHDDPGAAAAVGGRVTLRDAPAHLPARTAMRLEPAAPREALYELRIPRAWLRGGPQDDGRPVPFALAFNAAIGDPPRRLSCGFPANHAWNDRGTWGRLALSPLRR